MKLLPDYIFKEFNDLNRILKDYHDKINELIDAHNEFEERKKKAMKYIPTEDSRGE